MPSFLRDAISYSEEKLQELQLLAKACNEGLDSVSNEFQISACAIEKLQGERKKTQLNLKLDDLKALGLDRCPFESRYDAQIKKLKLPPLPTTTIGSFPQTSEVRQARNAWKRGKMSDGDYEEFIKQQIQKWIKIQEDIGIDVLVHGEPERNDMVEYFGEKLGGFLFTQNGWVQSYGSRCVKPPILYGDVFFKEPMTVKETVYAQSLTQKPVKGNDYSFKFYSSQRHWFFSLSGILTGPVTILNWSFVRDDLTRREVCHQIAMALREEVLALEKSGVGIIQMDEPAVREGLPLKESDWPEYLDWAVKGFKLSTCKVKPETQIHSHMCYSEFQDMIQSILDLDADVISIEASRSHGEMIETFEKFKYSKGIGLGVYDIHSPRIPLVQEMTETILRGLKVIDPKLFWINPDCGLKTRTDDQAIAALKNMVAAAREVIAKRITS